MKDIVAALAESTNLCFLAQESDDPALRKAALRVLWKLEKATNRIIDRSKLEPEEIP